jgi:transcriptional regulator with XRE-family HTH domain
MTTSFDDELRRLMAARGMSTRRLAREIPCDPGYVSKLAAGMKHPSRAIAARFDDVLDADGKLTDACVSAPARGLTARRLQALSPVQAEELLTHLQDQWHALVKTDNLLGPRYALSAVKDHLEVIGVMLRSAGQQVRPRILSLGARYAESAAWLHEDSDDLSTGRFWVRRCMEWAVEADDPLMVA